MNKSLFNTSRLDTEVAIVEHGTTTTIKAEGIIFEFDTEIHPDGKWHCTNITVTREARMFESTVFFYMDWLEDIFDNLIEIDQYVVHYMLFALNIEQDLTIGD